MIFFFTIVLISALAYGLGSVSPAWFAGRAKGLDLRFEGIETLDFENAGGVLGRPVGVTVFAADFFKGYIAVSAALIATDSGWGALLAGALVVAGQIWPLFHDFAGGKGGAVAAGVLAAAAPWTLAISLTLLALLSAITGRRTHAEVLVIVLMPGVAILAERADIALISLAAALACLLIAPRWREVEILLGAKKRGDNGDPAPPEPPA